RDAVEPAGPAAPRPGMADGDPGVARRAGGDRCRAPLPARPGQGEVGEPVRPQGGPPGPGVRLRPRRLGPDPGSVRPKLARAERRHADAGPGERGPRSPGRVLPVRRLRVRVLPGAVHTPEGAAPVNGSRGSGRRKLRSSELPT